MSDKDDVLYSRSRFLLALQGQITVHFMDGQTLEGKFARQDELNVFLQVDDTPVMIPRSQIRYIKGQPDQPIEEDDSQVILPEVEPEQPVAPDQPSPLNFDLYRTQADEEQLSQLPRADEAGTDTKISEPTLEAVTDDEDETGESVRLDEAAISAEQAAIISDIEEDLEDATFVLSGDEEIEDATFVLPDIDESEDDATFILDELDDLEEDTFVLPEETDEEDPTFLLVEKPEEAKQISAYLDCTGGPHAGERFELEGSSITVGRASNNIIALSQDKEISRNHAIIRLESGKFKIEDQNSLNGVFINDERIYGPRQLEPDDSILVGLSVLVYHEN